MTILFQLGEYSFSYVSGRMAPSYFCFKPFFDDLGYPRFYLAIGGLSIEVRSIWLDDIERWEYS